MHPNGFWTIKCTCMSQLLTLVDFEHRKSSENTLSYVNKMLLSLLVAPRREEYASKTQYIMSETPDQVR